MHPSFGRLDQNCLCADRVLSDFHWLPGQFRVSNRTRSRQASRAVGKKHRCDKRRQPGRSCRWYCLTPWARDLVPSGPLMPSSTRKTLIKHNNQARRRERENADFLGVIFFISFLLKIGHLQDDRIEIRQRLPSFLTLFFCNVSIPAKIRFEAAANPAVFPRSTLLALCVPQELKLF